MQILDMIDDDADTQRLVRPDFDSEAPTDPDATSIYDLTPPLHFGIAHASAKRRLLIRATRQNIAGLRSAIAAGWDVGPELAYEEQCLATLVAAERRKV